MHRLNRAFCHSHSGLTKLLRHSRLALRGVTHGIELKTKLLATMKSFAAFPLLPIVRRWRVYSLQTTSKTWVHAHQEQPFAPSVVDDGRCHSFALVPKPEHEIIKLDLHQKASSLLCCNRPMIVSPPFWISICVFRVFDSALLIVSSRLAG
jgi:hypothetical protein